MTPRIVSLFSGIGGLDLGIEAALDGNVVAHCEASPECREILSLRWPGVAMFTDVRTAMPPPCDVLIGGFPCQDISAANPNGQGLEGDRSGLWFAMLRQVETLRPRVVVVENSPRLQNKGLHVVRQGLEALGYSVEATRLRAEDVGAPHRRERMFVVAYLGDLPGTCTDVFGGLWTAVAEGTKVRRWQEGPGSAALWPTPTVKGNHNKAGLSAKSGDGLATAVTTAQWPTPTASSYGSNVGGAAGRIGKVRRSLGAEVKQWPTPTARDGHRAGYDKPGRPLSERARGPLNPPWVEALMGLPMGWTDPEDRRAHDAFDLPVTFPLGRGPAQHGWEPPRTVPPRSMPGRQARVKACGNAVVPQVAFIVGMRIRQALES